MYNFKYSNTLLIAAFVALSIQSKTQNQDSVIFTSTGVQTIDINFNIQTFGGTIQPYYIKTSTALYGVPEYRTKIIDSLGQENPYPKKYVSLYTFGECNGASNTYNAWAWGTFSYTGKVWIKVECPDCLIDCYDEKGNTIPCECYRLIPKKIKPFNQLTITLKPVSRIIYRA